ncbi:MAG: NAD-dependent epimerase/dehydratase family protein [Marinomonas sp.]
MRILITGGLGFIGRALCKQFLDEGGHELILIDPLSEQVHGKDTDYSDITDLPNVTHIAASICDAGVLHDAMYGVDLVYHFAAETGTGQSMYQIERYFETNVQGTAILLDTIVNQKDRRPKALMLASSRSIYGEGAYLLKSEVGQAEPKRHYPGTRSAVDMEAGQFGFEKEGQPLVPVATHEDDKLDPCSLYASSKLTQEQMCKIACETVGVRFSGLRLQNVYGPGQSMRNPYTGIISIFTNILRQGGSIDIFEDGEESRDFVFVEDVARAFRYAAKLDTESPSIYNVGCGEATTVSELVEMLENELSAPKTAKISGRFRPGDIRHNWADISRMKEHFGFVPEVPLTTGLSRTVQWALTQPVEEDRSAMANAELNTIASN